MTSARVRTIDQLPAAGSLDGTEILPMAQQGAASTVTAARLAAYVSGGISADLAALLAGKQPLDADLTAIAALATTGYGRTLLTLADAAAARGAVGLGNVANLAPADLPVSTAQAAINAALQPLDGDLTAISALATTTYGRALLTLADAAAGRVALGVVNLDIARADIAGRAIPLQAFTVQGFSSVGDGGQGATYVRGTSGGLMAIQDPAGTWWNLVATSQALNVKWFGAKGDGVTDDAPAINAAIAAAEARFVSSNYWGPAGTPAVVTPAGLYLHSGIDIRRAILFNCDNPGAAKFLLKAGSNRSSIKVYAPPQADPNQWGVYGQPLLRGFSIDGNASAQTGTSHGIEFVDAPYSISTRYASAGRVENVDITGASNAGIYAGQNRNLGFVSKCIIQYCNNYGVSFNACYDWSVADSSIGVNKVAGVNLYVSGAITFSNTAVYGNIGHGVQLQDGFGSYFWFTGGCIEGNTQHGLAIVPSANNSNGVVGISNTHFINNSASADNVSSHIYVRNFKNLALSNVVARVNPSTNPGAKYIIDNDATAPVAVSNLMYETTGAAVPYKTAAFATPTSIVGAINPMGGTFALNVPFSATSGSFTGAVFSPNLQTLGQISAPWGAAFARNATLRAGNDVDLFIGFDAGTARGMLQVTSGGTTGAVGTGTYDLLLQPRGGNVGVGTTGPGAKLDVAGTMRGQMLTLSAAPTASSIPASYWTVVKNTADGSVRLYANDGGTLKSVALA